MVFKYDVFALDGDTNVDNGLTKLHGDSMCIPNPGSFNADSAHMYAKTNEVSLTSEDETSGESFYCKFPLDKETGKISIVLESGKNPWTAFAQNGKTYAVNTREYLKNFVIETPASGGKRKRSTTKKNRRTRRAHSRKQGATP
jgi:hypothetical protein